MSRFARFLLRVFALAAVAAAPCAAQSQERDYAYPTWRGYLLDHSYYIAHSTQGPSPGIGPANAFCRAMGHIRATHWDLDTRPQRITTIHIGNGNLCTTLGNTCRGYRVIRCAGGAAATPPSGPAHGAFEFDTDRPGGDISASNIAGNWEECHRMCVGNLNCRAFTWVRPGVQGPSARCWLKNVVPGAQANGCCVSAVVR